VVLVVFVVDMEVLVVLVMVVFFEGVAFEAVVALVIVTVWKLDNVPFVVVVVFVVRVNVIVLLVVMLVFVMVDVAKSTVEELNVLVLFVHGLVATVSGA